MFKDHRFASFCFSGLGNGFLEPINMSLLRGLRFWGVLRFLQTCRSSGAFSLTLKKSGVPQIIAYSAGRDLQILAFRAPIFISAYGDLKITRSSSSPSNFGTLNFLTLKSLLDLQVQIYQPLGGIHIDHFRLFIDPIQELVVHRDQHLLSLMVDLK